MHVYIIFPSIRLKHRELLSISFKLTLPIIPLGIVAFVGQPFSKQLVCGVY